MRGAFRLCANRLGPPWMGSPLPPPLQRTLRGALDEVVEGGAQHNGSEYRGGKARPGIYPQFRSLHHDDEADMLMDEIERIADPP